MKTHFPVTESTLSASHLGEFLKTRYNLSSRSTCQLFRTGINHLYIISDGANKFVFRVYTFNWRSELEISEEIRLLLHLKQNDVPVSYAITDKENKFIQLIDAPEGNRYGVLFSFAPGKKKPKFEPKDSYAIGVAMAKLHHVTKNFSLNRITYNSTTLLTDSFHQAQSFFTNPSEEMMFVERTTHYLLDAYERINIEELRVGAVHMDIWFDNLHFNGNEITIFDFDFCGNGWLCYDIAYYLLQLFNTQQDESQYKIKAEHFWNGYESITAVSAEEKRIIPSLGVSIWFFYLGVQCNRFDTFSNVFLSEDYLRRFIGMIKKWITFNNIQLENFK